MTWTPPIDLHNLPTVTPTIRPWAQWILSPPAWALLSLPRRVDVQVEGLEHVPDPAILAMNHTHYIDWLPVRRTLQLHGRQLTSLVKPRTYQSAVMAAFLNTTGNIPLASRGYVISADLRCVLGRAPSEEEYRLLRDWTDGKTTEPADPSPDLVTLFTTPRDVLGHRYDPSRCTYAEMVNQVFCRLAGGAIDLARVALEQGSSLVIAPQGAFASRLTKGRIGGVQFAGALDLPVVPIGLSGMLEAYPNQGLRNVGGTLQLRFGPPVSVALPDDHVPFEKASEVRNHAILESETQRIMDAINDLLEPAYQWDDDPEGDALSGVARFIE